MSLSQSSKKTLRTINTRGKVRYVRKKCIIKFSPLLLFTSRPPRAVLREHSGRAIRQGSARGVGRGEKVTLRMVQRL